MGNTPIERQRLRSCWHKHRPFRDRPDRLPSLQSRIDRRAPLTAKRRHVSRLARSAICFRKSANTSAIGIHGASGSISATAALISASSSGPSGGRGGRRSSRVTARLVMRVAIPIAYQQSAGTEIPTARSSRQLPQHVMQNPAVEEILQLVGGIDPAQRGEGEGGPIGW